MRVFYVIAAIGAASCGPSHPLELPPPDVRVLYTESGKGDRGFNDSVFTGLENATNEFEFRKEEVTPKSELDATSVLTNWFNAPLDDDSPKLIITVGAPNGELVAKRNCDFGGNFVLHIDSLLPACPNERSFRFRVFVSSYLAGVASMRVSRLMRAGAVAGADVEPVNEFIRGFRKGVEDGGGEWVKTDYLAANESGFNVPGDARQAANEIYRTADVIIAPAGASAIGVIEAAKEKPDRYAIGVDSDQNALGPNVVIGSIVKRIDEVVRETIADINNGQFVSKSVDLLHASGYVSFEPAPRFLGRVEATIDEYLVRAAEAAALDRKAHP